MQRTGGCQRAARLLLPVLLRSAAPEGFEAVVVAAFVGEDVDHHVDEVEADPGRTLVEALGARAVALLDHPLYDLLGDAARLALGLGAGYHEVVGVGDEPFEVDEDHVPREHLARRPRGRCGHLVGQRLALGGEILLPCDRLIVPHRISSLKSPPSARFASPSYNLLLSMISRTPSGTRYLMLLPCNILRLIPVAEMSTLVHSTGKILSKFLNAASRWSSLERSYPGLVAATITTCSSKRSGSHQASKFDTSSAPVIKYQSSSGERSLRMPTVSTLYIARPASISTLSTVKRSLPSTAASTMASLSSAVARMLEASLCGGMPPGTNTTRARSSSVITCSATIMCPWCTGSKVPPKIPTFKKSTSLEVEHRLANPDLVARLRPCPPQGPHDPDPLQLVLEPLDTLPIAPVGLECEPLDTLPGDDVPAVLLFHPYALPQRPEDAMPTLRRLVDSPLTHPAQHLLESVAKFDNPVSRGRRNLRSLRESLPEIRPQLFLEQIHFVEHNDRGLLGEPGGVELGPQRAFRPFRVLARIEDEREEPCARHVPQKAVAQAFSFAGARDQPWYIRHHEWSAVDPLIHHPELGRKGGKRIVAHPGACGA